MPMGELSNGLHMKWLRLNEDTEITNDQVIYNRLNKYINEKNIDVTNTKMELKK